MLLNRITVIMVIIFTSSSIYSSDKPIFINSKEIKTIDIKFKGYIANDNVNKRELPSINSKVTGLLKIGSKIEADKRTINKDKIGNYENYWYHCYHPTFGGAAWIYGEFIKEGVFDKKAYIDSLPIPNYNSKLYESLLLTEWLNSQIPEGQGGASIFFDKNTIILSLDINSQTYYIESIKVINDKTISLNTKLLLCDNDSIYEKMSLTMTIRRINENEIHIKDNVFYNKETIFKINKVNK